MINWALVTPRNVAIIGVMAVVAFGIFVYFSKRIGSDS